MKSDSLLSIIRYKKDKIHKENKKPTTLLINKKDYELIKDCEEIKGLTVLIAERKDIALI